MKYRTLWLLTLTVAFSAHADIRFSGGSAEFMFTQLSDRAEGVSESEGRSLFRSPIDRTHLHASKDLMTCHKKHGWTRKSYWCDLPGTNSADILGRRIVRFGMEKKDEFSEMLDALVVDLNQAINEERTLAIRGRSAERLYRKLNQLTEEQDPSLYRRAGSTRWFNLPVHGVGISEMYCQMTDQKLLGKSYRCLVHGVRFEDTNAPVEVLE